MNDHHFTYPRVVPVRGTTISAHAVQAPPPAPVALQRLRPPARQAFVPTPKAATLAA